MSSAEFATEITAAVTYTQDRRYVAIADSPAGVLTTGPISRAGDVLAAIERLVRKAYPPGVDLYVHLNVSRPPWLHRLQPVRFQPDDDDERQLGLVVSFIDGGVMVLSPNSGAGIYAPEELEDVVELTAEEAASIERMKVGIVESDADWALHPETHPDPG